MNNVSDDVFVKHFWHTQNDEFYLVCEFCRDDLKNCMSYAENQDPDFGLVLKIIKD